MSKTAVQVLEEARALVGTPGCWIQGTMQEYGTCYCSLGAINQAAEGNPWGRGPRAPEQILARKFFQLGISVNEEVNPEMLGIAITKWNDDINRVHAHVLAAFDRAINLAKKYEAEGLRLNDALPT